MAFNIKHDLKRTYVCCIFYFIFFLDNISTSGAMNRICEALAQRLFLRHQHNFLSKKDRHQTCLSSGTVYRLIDSRAFSGVSNAFSDTPNGKSGPPCHFPFLKTGAAHKSSSPCRSGHGIGNFRPFGPGAERTRSGRRPSTFDGKFAVSCLFAASVFCLCLFNTTFVSSLAVALFSLSDYEEKLFSLICKMASERMGCSVSLSTLSSSVTPLWSENLLQISNISFSKNKKTCTDNNVDGRGGGSNDTSNADPGHKEEIGDRDNVAYNIAVEKLHLRISLKRLLEGKGVIEMCSLSGVRGVVETLQNENTTQPSGPPRPPKRFPPVHGSFAIDHDVYIKDVQLFVKYPEPYRSYPLYIHSAALPRLSYDYLLYDLLKAENVVGMFDNCLFHYRMPSDNPSTRQLKIAGVSVDHFYGPSTESILRWVVKGSVDMDVTVRLPPADEPRPNNKHSLLSKIWTPKVLDSAGGDADSLIGVEMNVRLQNMKGRVPKQPHNVLASLQNTMIRPIIGYINEHSPTVPLSITFSMKRGDFEGVWTLYNSGATLIISDRLSCAFMSLLEQEKRNPNLYKQVGLWTITSIYRNIETLMDGFSLHKSYRQN